jgi:transcriptional regulator with XRE-family HTH domain
MDISSTQYVHRGAVGVYHGDMAEVELNTFGDRVTWLLRRRRLAEQPIASQKELAARIGMKAQQLNAFMNGRRRPNVQHLRAIAAALETSVSFLALTSNDPSPDASPDAEQVGYISAQADEAAQLIDAMTTDTQRDLALQLVRQVAAYVGVSVAVERELVPVTERKNIPAQIEPVPGGMGSRWFLGDKSGR